MTPIALTIAGSDPSGGAGIQADLKTFHQRNVYGMSVLTLLTVQDTRSVDAGNRWHRASSSPNWIPCWRTSHRTRQKLARSVPAKSSRRLLGARPTFLFLW